MTVSRASPTTLLIQRFHCANDHIVEINNGKTTISLEVMAMKPWLGRYLGTPFPLLSEDCITMSLTLIAICIRPGTKAGKESFTRILPDFSV